MADRDMTSSIASTASTRTGMAEIRAGGGHDANTERKHGPTGSWTWRRAEGRGVRPDASDERRSLISKRSCPALRPTRPAAAGRPTPSAAAPEETKPRPLRRQRSAMAVLAAERPGLRHRTSHLDLLDQGSLTSFPEIGSPALPPAPALPSPHLPATPLAQAPATPPWTDERHDGLAGLGIWTGSPESAWPWPESAWPAPPTLQVVDDYIRPPTPTAAVAAHARAPVAPSTPCAICLVPFYRLKAPRQCAVCAQWVCLSCLAPPAFTFPLRSASPTPRTPRTPTTPTPGDRRLCPRCATPRASPTKGVRDRHRRAHSRGHSRGASRSSIASRASSRWRHSSSASLQRLVHSTGLQPAAAWPAMYVLWLRMRQHLRGRLGIRWRLRAGPEPESPGLLGAAIANTSEHDPEADVLHELPAAIDRRPRHWLRWWRRS
ncbi:uncharacterized protein V1510DRAFT_305229 [Dipodascopsis tothii]|uniref:uncharacterized protein n=1 Tax=Dipodascopsis tothii TaxID=44089 RepID=UPI0034CDC051